MSQGSREGCRRLRAPVALAVLAGCVTTGEKPLPSFRAENVQAEVHDPGGAPRQDLGSLVWGLGRSGLATPAAPAGWPDEGYWDPGAQDPEGQQREEQDPQEQERRRREDEARLRSQFGANVIILDDGRITQQYPFVGEAADVFLKLVRNSKTEWQVDGEEYPDFSQHRVGGEQDPDSLLGQMLGDREIAVSFLPNFTFISGVPIRDDLGKRGGPAVTGQRQVPQGGVPTHLALVTGMPSDVLAFERALDLFYANMPQVEIAVKVVEFSSSDALNFGVADPGGTPTLNNMDSKQLVRQFTSNFPLRAPLVAGSPVTDSGTFTLGGIHDTWELSVQLQALEANNLANILSSPKLVVRNGGMATISTFTDFPFPKARITQSGANVEANIDFRPVGVSMNILPTIAGTKTVMLQIYASVSAVTGFADTNPVDTPIVSDRLVTTTVHVNHEESIIIGGLIAESDFESETKVPILGDIPILGYLFRSTSNQRSENELQFIITPRIVRGTREIRAATGGL